jgi:hypothetical protein
MHIQSDSNLKFNVQLFLQIAIPHSDCICSSTYTCSSNLLLTIVVAQFQIETPQRSETVPLCMICRMTASCWRVIVSIDCILIADCKWCRRCISDPVHCLHVHFWSHLWLNTWRHALCYQRLLASITTSPHPGAGSPAYSDSAAGAACMRGGLCVMFVSIFRFTIHTASFAFNFRFDHSTSYLIPAHSHFAFRFRFCVTLYIHVDK